jgi:hypothetical protein
MAKVISGTGGSHVKSKVSRPGVHAKTKSSSLKSSKKYKKGYRGQGR